MKQHTQTQSLLVSFLLLTAVVQVNGQASPRKMLWLNGPSQTSSRWDRAKTSAQLAGYQMSEVNIGQYAFQPTTKSIPEWSAIFNQKLDGEGHNNVLGIGHDAGGLILRYMGMNQQDERLSAMILDGVPNQGAGIMNYLLSNSAGFKSVAQITVEKNLRYRSNVQGCKGCQILEATKSWVDEFTESSTKAYYENLHPGSPTIGNLDLPSIPYAVIWGNEDEKDALTLTRLVTSWANAGTIGEDSDYIDCYRKELEQRLQAASAKHLLGLLSSISNLAGAAAKIKVGPNDPYGGPAVIVSNAIRTADMQVRSHYNLAKELRELFECELVQQALNADWNIMVSHYSITPIVETFMLPSDCISCENCYEDTDQQVVGYCLSVCELDCPPLIPYSTTVLYYTIDPHDGLLTREEQLLAGAAKTYEAKKCNHFQEQFWQNQPIADAFNDLFMGGAGAAFVVPK